MLAITIHFFSEKRARKNRLFLTYIKKIIIINLKMTFYLQYLQEWDSILSRFPSVFPFSILCTMVLNLSRMWTFQGWTFHCEIPSIIATSQTSKNSHIPIGTCEREQLKSLKILYPLNTLKLYKVCSDE